MKIPRVQSCDILEARGLARLIIDSGDPGGPVAYDLSPELFRKLVVVFRREFPQRPPRRRALRNKEA